MAWIYLTAGRRGFRLPDTLGRCVASRNAIGGSICARCALRFCFLFYRRTLVRARSCSPVCTGLRATHIMGLLSEWAGRILAPDSGGVLRCHWFRTLSPSVEKVVGIKPKLKAGDGAGSRLTTLTERGRRQTSWFSGILCHWLRSAFLLGRQT